MHQGGDVGRKDEPKRKCSGCNGEGGHWEVSNGGSFKKRRWRTCALCKGKKYV
jgi:DnaJ-class molecular chaperone